jgi:hypothetical protein
MTLLTLARPFVDSITRTAAYRDSSVSVLTDGSASGSPLSLAYTAGSNIGMAAPL